MTPYTVERTAIYPAAFSDAGIAEHIKSNNGHIVAIVPRGEVLRNFEYSGTFERIANEAKLSLLTISPTPELNIELKRKYENVFQLEELDERWLVRFQREILDVAHGRWLWSEAAKRRWQLRDAEARSIGEKVKRSAKKTLGCVFANDLGLNLLTRSERNTSRLFSSSDQYTDLYKRIRPSLVFNGSHIHSRNAIQAVQAAQWLGIPTATFIFSWDNLTSQGRITLPYDYFLVWNEELKEQLLKIYDWIKPENVIVTGTPQFDFHFRPEFYQERNEYCHQVGADPGRPIIFYATGMPNHMPGEPEIVEGIADMLMGFEAPARPQLLVRVYPKDRSGRFEELKGRRKDILFPTVAWEDGWLTPKYEDSYALVNTLRHCVMGINVASTVSLELCMFDKPVVNVGYDPKNSGASKFSYADYYEFDHYKPIVKSGAVPVANSEADMFRQIKEAISDSTARKNERKDLIQQMFGTTLDGNSGKRVADTLLNYARQDAIMKGEDNRT